ncbi:MAG: hypothetical protein M1819_006958 [Sarea resinae]|nr:MAG: hypothetical protein M1819_006958 [Sarea resinae]
MSPLPMHKVFPSDGPPRRRGLQVAALSFALATATFLFVYSVQTHQLPRPLHLGDVDDAAPLSFESEQQQQCALDVDALQAYGLSQAIHYTQLNIIAVPSENASSSSQQLNVPFPESQVIRLDDPNRSANLPLPGCADPVKIHVPPIPPHPPNASHVIFGVATTFDRLDGSLSAMAHWASHSNTRIFAIIEPTQSPDKIEALVRKAASLHFTLLIRESSAEYLDRYFSLVRALYEECLPSTQWAALIDDDTFFLSLPRLLGRLSRYDANVPHYIGSLSEDLVQMNIWGYMAYGGAGIFLSTPLLKQLNAPEIYDVCSTQNLSGDRRLAKCIYGHTTTKLEIESGLHQLDLSGDASGFYECGRDQPLSVHHWKSAFAGSTTRAKTVDMVHLAAVASVGGTESLLRRFRFADGWFLANGYSVFKPGVSGAEPSLAAADFSIEKTWDTNNGGTDEAFDHTLGPLRPKDEGKFSLRLAGVVREGEGGSGLEGDIKDDDVRRVRQYYIHRADPRSGDHDTVVEVVWQRQ